MFFTTGEKQNIQSLSRQTETITLRTCGFLLLVFGICFGDVLSNCIVHIVLVRSMLLCGWPFGKELPARLTLCSLCVICICNFIYSPFWF